MKYCFFFRKASFKKWEIMLRPCNSWSCQSATTKRFIWLECTVLWSSMAIRWAKKPILKTTNQLLCISRTRIITISLENFILLLQPIQRWISFKFKLKNYFSESQKSKLRYKLLIKRSTLHWSSCKWYISDTYFFYTKFL